MSLPTTIIAGLQVIGMVGGSYFGCRNSDQAQRLYRTYLPKRPLKLEPKQERLFFHGMGGLAGVWVGYTLWPVAIPLGVVQALRDKEYYKRFF